MSKRIDLTKISVFDSFLQFDFEGENIDLHNDFDCTNIETNPFTKQVLLHFESPSRYFRLVFFEARVFHLRLGPIQAEANKGFVFHSLSKVIAITDEDGNYLELPKLAHFYSVEFYEDVSLVVEAQKVILIESDKEGLELLRALQEKVSSLSGSITELKARLADLQKYGSDTKTFLTQRKTSKEELANLEQQLVLKQEKIIQLQEHDRLLLTSA